ncbi:hypothetical protein NFI96_020464, partial [Prochilodus magdalenae]
WHGVTQNGSGSSSVTSPALVLVETPNESVCGGTVVSTKMTRPEDLVSLHLHPYRTICRNCIVTLTSSTPHPPFPNLLVPQTNIRCFSFFSSGSYLLLLISADVTSAGPTPLSSTTGLSRPLLDVPLGLEEHEGAPAGLAESSRESSGFYSEDSEENKVHRTVRQWGGQGEVNTSLDADSLIVPADGAVAVEVEGHQVFWTCDNRLFILVLTTVPPHTDSLGVSTKTKAGLVTEDDPLPKWASRGLSKPRVDNVTRKCNPPGGRDAVQKRNDSGTQSGTGLMGYNPSRPRLSSLSLRKEPKETNSSAFFAPVAETLDPERWESDSETSGFPLHPSSSSSSASSSSSSLSTTAAVPLTHATVTEFKQNGPPPEATAAHDNPFVPEDEERQNLLTQAPTVPEVGPFPSQTPLQPDDTRRDDSEEQEEEDEEDDGEEELVAFPTEVDGEEEDDWTHLTAGPSDMPAVAFTQMTWQDMEVTKPGDDEETELRHGGTEYLSEADLHDSQEAVQVICVDWSDLAGKGYVILNMSDNYDCEDFRMESGDRLLEMLESAFSRKMNSPQGSWLISLSKPSRQERQLLMTLASEQGVIATKDVLSMLGEMRRGLYEIGIQNFSSVSTCHSRPSQTRSDYGKLFVVLVIIGSVCVIIIASGLIYICWQRRLPKMKNMSRGEELHFVENGCHDNPTLDVTSDGQSEMQEKKHSANGVPVGGGGGSGWQVLVNKPGKEEEDNQEEDTHL